MHRSSRLLIAVLLGGGLLVSLSGCDPVRTALDNLEEETVVLQPVKTAAVHDVSWTNFGICHTRLERRVVGSHLGSTFSSRRDSSIDGLVGHEVRVARGQTCHLRVVHQFQTAIAFDLTGLPAGVISRATLKLRSISDYGLDPPIRFGGTLCQDVGNSIERATADWERPPPHEEAPEVPVMLRDLIPSTPLRPRLAYPVSGGSYNVSGVVRAWTNGESPNFGFVVTPHADEVARRAATVGDTRDQFMCGSMLRDARLEVSVLVRR